MVPNKAHRYVRSIEINDGSVNPWYPLLRVREQKISGGGNSTQASRGLGGIIRVADDQSQEAVKLSRLTVQRRIGGKNISIARLHDYMLSILALGSCIEGSSKSALMAQGSYTPPEP
jgi:hypothetical protein